MKTCPKCSELNGNSVNTCYKCNTPLPLDSKKICSKCNMIYDWSAENCESCHGPLTKYESITSSNAYGTHVKRESEFPFLNTARAIFLIFSAILFVFGFVAGYNACAVEKGTYYKETVFIFDFLTFFFPVLIYSLSAFGLLVVRSLIDILLSIYENTRKK